MTSNFIHGSLNKPLEQFAKYNDCVFMCVDFNAKVEKNDGTNSCLGRYSRGIRKTIGQILVYFCEAHNLFIASSVFNHKSDYITTWQSTRVINRKLVNVYNQIDYIICSQKFEGILQQSRIFKGTQVESDHILVVAKFNMRTVRMYLPKNTKKAKKVHPDYSKLVTCSETRSEYQHRICIKLAENPDADWDTVAAYLREEAEVPPGHKKTS